MAREIKFRGFNRKNQTWLYGFYLQKRGAHFVCPDEFADGKSWDDYEIDPNTLGQFTGLRDDSRREIYEGDIVKLYEVWNMPQCVVEYHLDGFFLISIHNGSEHRLIKEMRIGQVGVLGNIHDNPGLLK